ncbi:helix-turn-helix domain-containing protein [Streptomyces sp. NBC_00057]|uniref:helix-turn-helix domain-containing protein n=1 Tax=Streptomyces sp. NBC_00057 TaxID=2975634 RepID=UPI00324736FC
MAERVRVREIDDDEGRRLLRIIRRGTGSVVTWRRAQMVLLSAQGMPVAKIAEVTFTSNDRVRDVIHNFDTDGFGSLYPKYKGGRPLMPHPGRQWAERGGRYKDPDREPRRRRRATYTCPHGVRHLFAALDLAKDKLYGHIKLVKKRTQFLAFCRYLRSLYPPEVRIAIVCDNFFPHLTTKKCQRVGTWAAANNVEIACTPTNSSWLNRIEAQFTALRYFTLDGTDHASHKEQGSVIRRYIIWRNRHANDERLRAVVDRANVA